MREVLEADNLKSLAGIRHGFFTRLGGISEGGYGSLNAALSSGDKPENVRENRRRIAAHFGLQPERLLACHQIHSPDVVTVSTAWEAMNNPKADAMVTKIKGIALGTLTADCMPILFADASASVIGTCHAGWRGAVTGVIENTVAAMEKLGANRKAIHAAIGPCIWQNSYEVGPEFPAPFLAENPEYKKFFKPAFKSDRYMFDLSGYAAAKLKEAKLIDIQTSLADTCADETRFFSHRRSTLRKEEHRGSLISVIVLAE